MSAASAPARMTPRHVQLLRAVFAALAGLMITFSPDHSAEIGLAVFAGFATATGLVLALAAWLVRPAGQRGRIVLLVAIYVVAGTLAGLPALRSTVALFVTLIAWGFAAGITELAIGIADRRAGRDRVAARDTIVMGALTILLAVATAIVPAGYRLDYFIEEAGRSFTLTGTIIAVGLFGGYAALVAVYQGIAGLSPQPPAPAQRESAAAAPGDAPSATPTPKDQP